MWLVSKFNFKQLWNKWLGILAFYCCNRYKLFTNLQFQRRFFCWKMSTDVQNVCLQLEILTNLATETNIATILREFQVQWIVQLITCTLNMYGCRIRLFLNRLDIVCFFSVLYLLLCYRSLGNVLHVVILLITFEVIIFM